LRREHPRLAGWFSALEEVDAYRGIIADFHTHAHDLPPQMGRCCAAGTREAAAAQELVDNGP
jgi:glutathione S-transferase